MTRGHSRAHPLSRSSTWPDRRAAQRRPVTSLLLGVSSLKQLDQNLGFVRYAAPYFAGDAYTKPRDWPLVQRRGAMRCMGVGPHCTFGFRSAPHQVGSAAASDGIPTKCAG